ncbi:TspO/MBR family protein [Donghicola sp.]|jgi:tryptophan-rich sensory protein|uniref:tryptophan-rich sensory protein TspO n=1 Tax=Donghicola sp. TaxID=1929294 RepID=UPI0025F58D71|nr:TspO/MBR family protein [Donghicola sp.]MCT4577187.1 tryptophan-rich sensory protein [Donghicola sp.]
MDWTIFIILLAASGAAAASGVLFKPGAWYVSLQKPSFTPPNWAFPVVWTTLYVLMALAGARAAFAGGPLLGMAMALWALQIALNTLWTPVFFGAHRIRLGMVIISIMWITIAILMGVLWQIDWLAGMLFVPYLAWVTVAAALNGSIWRNNPDALRS